MRAIADGLLWTECTDGRFGKLLTKTEQWVNCWRSVLARRKNNVVRPSEPNLSRLGLITPVEIQPVWHPRAFVR